MAPCLPRSTRGGGREPLFHMAACRSRVFRNAQGLSRLRFLPISLGTVRFPSISESGDHPSFTHSLGPAPHLWTFPGSSLSNLEAVGGLGESGLMPLVLRFPQHQTCPQPQASVPQIDTILQNPASRDSPSSPSEAPPRDCEDTAGPPLPAHLSPDLGSRGQLSSVPRVPGAVRGSGLQERLHRRDLRGGPASAPPSSESHLELFSGAPGQKAAVHVRTCVRVCVCVCSRTPVYWEVKGQKNTTSNRRD